MIPIEITGNYVLSLGYGELNNEPKAMAAAQASLELARKSKNPSFEKQSLTFIGGLQRRFGKKQEAIQTYNQALAIKVQGKAVGADSGIYAGLGRAYADLNQTQLAIVSYKEAINRIEEVRSGIKLLTPELQASFLQATVDFGKVKTSDIYRQLADLLSSQGRNAEAQQILELLALQNINDFTRQTRGNTKVTDVELSNAEKQIVNKHGTLIAFGKQLVECDNKCSQLSSLKNQYRQLTEEFNQLVKSIKNSEVDKSSINKVYDRTSDLIAGASKIVDEQEDTVLIYPLVLKDKIRILWASKGGVFGSKVCKMGEGELNTDVTSFRKLLQNPSSDIKQIKATGKKLYDCLIQPVEAELKANKIKHLVFVPDLAINYIPMGALFDGEKYLLDNYTITSVLNVGLTNFEETLPSEVKKTQVLGLGLSKEMTTRDGVFPALKNVIRELDSIIKSKPNDTKGIYPGDKFVDQDFNIDALENNLQGRNILHIATHALFKPKDPTKSYILLGTGTEYPIDQIQFLNNLRGVHLVVLSACETALGGLDQNGMEIKGISSFFLKDKAKAVMASLWKVDDPSTYQLMQLFYQNLASKMAKSEALRQAQLSLLKGNNSTSRNPKERSIRVNIPPGTSSRNEEAQSGYSHPYYWAPFILIGNGL
jgi:CHAT domain-containing protein